MRYIILAFFLLISTTCFASQISARLSLNDKSLKELHLGDVVSMSLVLWPMSQDLEPEILSKLHTESLIPGVYIIDLISVERSPSNYDALVLDFKGVFTEHLQSYLLNIGQNSIMVELKDFMVKEGNYGDQPIIAEKNYKITQWWPYLLLLVVIVLLSFVAIKVFKASRKKKVEALRIKTQKELLVKKLIMVEDRAELEEFIANKNEYFNYSLLSEQDLHELVGYVESIQYKKSWTQEEIKITNDLLNQIRKNLK
jgi:hypothetical protein